MELLDPRQVKVSVFCVVFSHALRSEDQTFHHVCDGSFGLGRKGFGRGSHLTSGHFRKSWLSPDQAGDRVAALIISIVPISCLAMLGIASLDVFICLLARGRWGVDRLVV